MQNQSLPFIRTHNAIIQAFIRLMKSMSFESMTVQNILDETPVTRATFYRHFKDKYEIAEHLFQEYIDAEATIREHLEYESKDKYAEIFRSSFEKNRDLLETLLKIQTDRVNLRAYLSSRYETAYNADSGSSYSQIESKVYAAAMTAFQMAFFETPQSAYSSDIMDMVMTPVFLKLIDLDKDPETTAFFKRKFKERSRAPLKKKSGASPR